MPHGVDLAYFRLYGIRVPRLRISYCSTLFFFNHFTARGASGPNICKMKNVILFFLLIFGLKLHSECTISCRGRYAYQKTFTTPTENGSYSGSEIGTTTLYGGGGYTYTSWIWTNTYNLSVTFRSGYEINESDNKMSLPDNIIIATVHWSNGGYTNVLISRWTTNEKYMTEEELLFTTNGESIYEMNGIDTERKSWEFYF